MIFRNKNILGITVKELIDQAISSNYDDTGVGFYSTVELKTPLKKIPDIKMWEYNFNHPKFSYGGSFMCTIINESQLELEAVAFGGDNWPTKIDPSQFEELT